MPQPASEFKANTRGWQNLSGETSEERRARAAKSVERGKERDSLESPEKRRARNFRNVARQNAEALGGKPSGGQRSKAASCMRQKEPKKSACWPEKPLDLRETLCDHQL